MRDEPRRLERDMADAIAVLNAGSSSLKFSLFQIAGEALVLVARGQVEGLTTHARFAARDAQGATLATYTWPDEQRPDHAAAARHLLGFLRERAAGRTLVAVGHRVVHGGPSFTRPVRVNDATLDALERLVPLAPLHQPHNLAPMRALRADAPELPQVACFDTAFHRTQSRLASSLALPSSITDAGVQRYGFHGLSYEYIASKLPALDAKAATGRTVVAHLGNGASMCAILGGASVASTMGFTALDGLMMGTRAGALDPGVILHLLDALRMDARAIERLLYHESGLLGVSGVSSDMRTLLGSTEPSAAFAIELFCYRASRELGSLAAALGGLDALVFTGGIGEHAAPVRAAIVRASAWLGLDLDDAANRAQGPCITSAASAATAYVLPTDEEVMIARHTLNLLREGVA
jgi:acetate kinase